MLDEGFAQRVAAHRYRQIDDTASAIATQQHLPALAEFLQVRALQKLIGAFGESLIEAINPVTGRLHTNFLIAGASTGRFSARGPNLQQMPKRRRGGFRKIFAAPAGQVVMALDYFRSSCVPWLNSSAIGSVSTASCGNRSPPVWMRTPRRRCR